LRIESLEGPDPLVDGKGAVGVAPVLVLVLLDDLAKEVVARVEMV
jgi:hypothetical protein